MCMLHDRLKTIMAWTLIVYRSAHWITVFWYRYSWPTIFRPNSNLLHPHFLLVHLVYLIELIRINSIMLIKLVLYLFKFLITGNLDIIPSVSLLILLHYRSVKVLRRPGLLFVVIKNYVVYLLQRFLSFKLRWLVLRICVASLADSFITFVSVFQIVFRRLNFGSADLKLV